MITEVSDIDLNRLVSFNLCTVKFAGGSTAAIAGDDLSKPSWFSQTELLPVKYETQSPHV
jgi:hypothetical protein